MDREYTPDPDAMDWEYTPDPHIMDWEPTPDPHAMHWDIPAPEDIVVSYTLICALMLRYVCVFRRMMMSLGQAPWYGGRGERLRHLDIALD